MPGAADPERSYRAINLMTLTRFAAKVFVHPDDVAQVSYDASAKVSPKPRRPPL